MWFHEFRNRGGRCYLSRAVVHSIVPLAVLEAVKNLDTPVEDGLTEFAEELLVKRLGLSPTVAMQLAEYEQLGRRAARRAVHRIFPPLRLFGHFAARRTARAVLGADLARERHLPVARVADPIAIHATPDGAACGFYGAALAELLRLLVGYEGAMLHTACRATGAAACEWRAAPPDPRHH